MFVWFLEETLSWKNHFDFFWPLLTCLIKEHALLLGTFCYCKREEVTLPFFFAIKNALLLSRWEYQQTRCNDVYSTFIRYFIVCVRVSHRALLHQPDKKGQDASLCSGLVMSPRFFDNSAKSHLGIRIVDLGQCF